MRNIASKQALKIAALSVFVIVLSIGGWLGWKVFAATSSITGNKNPLQLVKLFTPTQLKQSNGRTNILLTGYSIDDPGHQGAELTDSIMVLSIDQTKNSAVVISIPRDLWVNIPNYGYQKINAAYVYGGMSNLEQVVEKVTGLNINYYALINYTAFKDAVDAIGGVTINIQSDDPGGLYDPYTNIKLPNGSVTLNGQQALNLARARGDGPGSYGFSNGDFDRIKYQQALILALKDKAGATGVIANPFKIGDLASSIGDNLKTDMQINELETVFSASKKIGDNKITADNLNNINNKQLLMNYATDSGQLALVPISGVDDYKQIQDLVQTTLSSQ